MHVHEIILTIVVAILGSSAFATLVQIVVQRHYAKKDEQYDDIQNIRKAVKVLAHDAFIRYCRYLDPKKELTEDELENLNFLYEGYHSLGLNNTGDKLYKQIIAKPVKVNREKGAN